jgi:hypothetical protein
MPIWRHWPKIWAKRSSLAHPEDWRAYEINGDLAMRLSENSEAIEILSKEALELRIYQITTPGIIFCN